MIKFHIAKIITIILLLVIIVRVSGEVDQIAAKVILIRKTLIDLINDLPVPLDDL